MFLFLLTLSFKFVVSNTFQSSIALEKLFFFTRFSLASFKTFSSILCLGRWDLPRYPLLFKVEQLFVFDILSVITISLIQMITLIVPAPKSIKLNTFFMKILHHSIIITLESTFHEKIGKNLFHLLMLLKSMNMACHHVLHMVPFMK